MPSIPINLTGSNLSSSALGVGDYSLTVFGQGASAAGSYVLPYELAFTVIAPEPATAAMLLLGLTVLRLRKRTPSADD